MCFAKPPKPEPAPLPPDKGSASLAAVAEQRRRAAGTGRQSTILSGVSNEDFATTGGRKTLLGQ